MSKAQGKFDFSVHQLTYVQNRGAWSSQITDQLRSSPR